MSQPTVSVIMPTYNQAWFLRHALYSIAAQTYRDFELIIVDDGSTDETPEVLASVRSDSSGRYNAEAMVRQDNRGTAAAINAGEGVSRGRYLTWVSSDNLMHPLFLERLVAELDAGAGCAYGGFFWWPVTPSEACSIARVATGYWSREGEHSPGPAAMGLPFEWVCRSRALHQPYDPARQIAQEACYLGPAHLVRREVWAEHRGKISHDLDAFLRIEEACWERGLPIVGVDEPLCVYFAHSERATVTRRAEYDAPHWLAEARKRRAFAATYPGSTPGSNVLDSRGRQLDIERDR